MWETHTVLKAQNSSGNSGTLTYGSNGARLRATSPVIFIEGKTETDQYLINEDGRRHREATGKKAEDETPLPKS